MSPPVVEAVTEVVELGEGPHWDLAQQCLYYVDILGQAIHKYVPSSNSHFKAQIEEGPVSMVIPVEGSSDRFLISVGRNLAIATWDGSSPTVSKLETLLEVDTAPGYTNNRFNDGKADPSGRLWAGTMGAEPVIGHVDPEKGSLFKMVTKKRVKPMLDRISISNGLAWDTGLRKMYYIDSMKRTVDKFDYDLEKGEMTDRKVAFDFREYGIPGVPDGMTIDTDGNLWVAVFDGGRILKVDPRNGKLLTTVTVPAKQTTAVAFGGPNMDVLYVTSAKMTVNGEVQGKPAGAVFKVLGTGSKGLPGVSVKL